MLSREELMNLAQVESPHSSAVSFYFQPQVPQDKSHRQEVIEVKDLVRDALRRAEKSGNNMGLRQDLQRILALAETLRGNHSRGKVVFACRERGLWKEMDVPPRLGRTQLIVNSRLHLKPLVAACSGLPTACISLVDRKHARIFVFQDDELSTKPDLELGQLPKTGRSDGYLGYEAGHRERHIENEIIRNYKQLADSLMALMRQEGHDALLIGCRDETWPDIEPQLHPYLKQRLLGRFVADPNTATPEEVREHVDRILRETTAGEQQGLIREVIGEAGRNGRGAVGLRHVLTSLERQEVQVLLVSRNFSAEAVECLNCRHLDTRMVATCAVCGQSTRTLSDVSDALVDLALRNGAEIRFIDGDSDLERAGKVGALLRFRADQTTAEKVAV